MFLSNAGQLQRVVKNDCNDFVISCIELLKGNELNLNYVGHFYMRGWHLVKVNRETIVLTNEEGNNERVKNCKGFNYDRRYFRN